MKGQDIAWTKTAWTKAALDHKRVEFHLPSGSEVVEGVGEFLIAQNPEGLFLVQILVDRRASPGSDRQIQNRFYLWQDAVDKLRRHPDPAVADFLLE